jgi:hypothetical protein
LSCARRGPTLPGVEAQATSHQRRYAVKSHTAAPPRKRDATHPPEQHRRRQQGDPTGIGGSSAFYLCPVILSHGISHSRSQQDWHIFFTTL